MEELSEGTQPLDLIKNHKPVWLPKLGDIIKKSESRTGS